MQSIRLLLACGGTAHAMLMCAPARVSAPRAAAVRMDFGDSFYSGFDARHHVEDQLAQASASWRSGGPFQRQITP